MPPKKKKTEIEAEVSGVEEPEELTQSLSQGAAKSAQPAEHVKTEAKTAVKKPRAPKVFSKTPAKNAPKFQGAYLSDVEYATLNGKGDVKVRFYRNIAIGFFALTIILFGAVFFITFKKVKIKVIARPRSVEVSSIAVVETVKKSPNAIQGEIEVFEENFVREFKPQTVRELEGVASGTVTLINNTDNSQPLVATTRLLSEAGVLFRIKKSVVIPARGKIETEAYADKSGAGGNIGPAKFTIPGLWVGLQKDIYAESKLGMTGGIKSIGIIGEEDVKRAREEFEKLFEENAKIKAKDRHSDFSAIAVKIQNFAVGVDGEVGSEVDKFTLTGKAEVLVAAYDERELTDWADNKLKEKYGSDDILVSFPESPPAVSIEDYNKETASVRLSVVRTADVRLNKDSPLLSRASFAGKSAGEIQAAIGQISGVDAVVVEFFPSWVDTAPRSQDRINITIEESAG